MIPTYRLARSFGAIAPLSDTGLSLEGAGEHDADGPDGAADHGAASASGLFEATRPFLLGPDGEVIGVAMPDGAEATEEQLAEDANAWSANFARDARGCHAENHDHDCTQTCVK